MNQLQFTSEPDKKTRVFNINVKVSKRTQPFGFFVASGFIQTTPQTLRTDLGLLCFFQVFMENTDPLQFYVHIVDL